MHEFKTQGVCSKKINFKVVDGVVSEVSFVSGCDGNLKGLCRLVEGMKVGEVVEKLADIQCGSKTTSCPAQLAIALRKFVE